jgi:DNA-binding NarL/FixJ family response regulator
MHVMWRWAEYESGQTLTAPDPGGALLDCAALEAEGIAFLADGRHTAAARRFLDAASSWRPILVRSALRCRWAAGHALAVGGDATEAAALLEPLDGELDRSWCPALRPRLRASLRLAAATSRSADPVERTGDGLSPRERSVMLGVAEGLTSVEIGRRLGITAATVNTHVHAAKRKLGARTRVEAAAMVGLGA